ncbi:hypothetical protein Tco_0590754 [Tanacetum coccineum]
MEEPKGAYLESVNRGKNGSYTLKQLRQSRRRSQRLAIIDRGKRNHQTSCIDFEKFQLCEELNSISCLFSQNCDKKHNDHFTERSVYLISLKYKFVMKDLGELRAPRKNVVYQSGYKEYHSFWRSNLFGCKGNKGEAFLMPTE